MLTSHSALESPLRFVGPSSQSISHLMAGAREMIRIIPKLLLLLVTLLSAGSISVGRRGSVYRTFSVFDVQGGLAGSNRAGTTIDYHLTFT